VIAEVLDNLERTSGLGWPRQRCQVEEEAVVARGVQDNTRSSGGQSRKR
jgi:hypothetical protein